LVFNLKNARGRENKKNIKSFLNQSQSSTIADATGGADVVVGFVFRAAKLFNVCFSFNAAGPCAAGWGFISSASDAVLSPQLKDACR